MSLKSFIVVSAIGAGLVMAGCASGSNVAMPSTDKDLRHSKKVLETAATQRSYPAEAAKVEKPPVQAEIDYQLNVINLINFGDADWKEMVVWVNGKYSAPLGLLPAKQQRGVPFGLLFDGEGKRAPGKGVWVEKVEVQMGGNVYLIRTRPAD